MRDPYRIDVICENLRQLRYRFPDQRFGQLVDNYINLQQGDMFFQEDDETLMNIMNKLAELEQKGQGIVQEKDKV